MAITAATGADRIVRGGPGKSLFEDGKSVSGAGSTWAQGSLICVDAGTGLLRPVAATADAATLAGISDNAVTNGKLAGPYDGLTAVDAAQSPLGFVGPKFAVSARLTLKTGDAFPPSCKVYAADGLDNSTVSSVDPGDHNYVGIYVGANIAAAAALQTGDILVGSRYPSGTGSGLHF